MHRRLFLTTVSGILFLPGCISRSSSEGHLEAVWGRRGFANGRFFKPRAMTIDGHDQLYIVDMTGRIQVFSTDGQYLRGWQTPQIRDGKPCGLSFDREGNLLVADTHYYRVLIYTPAGELFKERTIGGTPGRGPGQFGFVTDAIQDSQGCYYVAEYGEYDRIQKFSRDGQFLFQWGGHGETPGQFIRPQSLALDDRDHVWVTDACNHRIQVFDATGREARLVNVWGKLGGGRGELRYPYGLVLDGQGHAYVCEFGNHRVQKFTLGGQSLGTWGTNGRRAGELDQPWAIVLDTKQRIHVLDTYNHRVQRIVL